MNYWGTNIFKGRIGEAIVESTLLQFGYKVNRIGHEYEYNPETNDLEYKRFAPDLLVIDPVNKKNTFLEIKLRSFHPMKVKIEKAQIERSKRYYPKTVLVFVSAYNGSINCLDIQNPVLNDDILNKDGFYELDLLDEEWQPLWHYFPLVQKGEQTNDYWYSLKETLNDFASNRNSKTKDSGFFAEEQETLSEYITQHWNPLMLDHNIISMNPDKLSLEAAWKQAIDIHSFRFAFELCGQDNVDHPAFRQVMDKIRGEMGEKYITIPYEDIKESLSAHPELNLKMEQLEKDIQDAPPFDAGAFLMERLLEIVPPGIGKARLLPEKGYPEDSIEVDLYTVLALLERRNCLYD
ncbi:hypothetical protein ACFLUG_05080 [Chloroflexota bacterium]